MMENVKTEKKYPVFLVLAASIFLVSMLCINSYEAKSAEVREFVAVKAVMGSGAAYYLSISTKNTDPPCHACCTYAYLHNSHRKRAISVKLKKNCPEDGCSELKVSYLNKVIEPGDKIELGCIRYARQIRECWFEVVSARYTD
ncbi:MAG: hypothetical protein AB1297_06890 [bacterium]